MLVLARKKGESLMIGDQIELVILGTDGDSVKVGVVAPQSVSIYRKEVYLAIQESNREAMRSSIVPGQMEQLFRKEE